MKLTVFFMTLALMQVHASGYSQSITISRHHVTLDKILQEIRKQTGYSFLYTDEQMLQEKKVDLELKNASLTEALDACFKGQDLTYNISDKVIIVKRKPVADEQPAPLEQEVRGKVTNEKGEPLPGVTIQINGTAKEAVTK